MSSVVANILGNLLLCGHESGEVALWDVMKGTLLKRITDLHQHSISKLQFTSHLGESASAATEASAISVDVIGQVHRIR